MKPLLGNAAAESLTCHVREADANLLNLLLQSSPYLPVNRSNPGPIDSQFFYQLKRQKKSMKRFKIIDKRLTLS
jgi:hypothetical protein